MILYFDNYITDNPFHAGGHETLGEVRHSSADIYTMPSKLDITLYSLASYVSIKWSAVIIKYELENISQKKKFEREVKKLFPKAQLIYGRSDSQKKFQESIKIMDAIKDEWIFYAGNNDHPFIAPNTATLDACLKKAEEVSKKHTYVSIAISHFTEFYNKVQKGTPFREIHFYDTKIKEETKEYFVSSFPRGLNHSMQIVNKNLFKHWFFGGDSKGILVRRSECMESFVKTVPQIVIIPKKELCAHFDAEVPHSKSPYGLSYDLCPALFIPPGFFENTIKIAYGYDTYRPGWVNINPLKENYSFRDSINGTDMKIGIDDIPLFWKKKIKTLDINKNLNKKMVEEALKKRAYELRNPFPRKSNLYYFFYRQKNLTFRLLHSIPFIRAPIKMMLKKSNAFKKFYNKLIQIKFT